ncbi:MAG: transporter substrate-binding domain-containing protein [Hyphomicrobiaceae bacterium]|nr:transporter substrate-binding domain-containing protein [Hyphomicrobiaceae bacterium]
MAAAGVLLLLLLLDAAAPPVAAQSPASRPADAVAVAGQPSQRIVLRFLTAGDFPPFNFYDEDGVLTGFNVDLARAICLELDVTCEVRAIDWQTLLPSLKRREADAIIAAQRITGQLLVDVDVTDRYFHTPGRFAGRRTPDVAIDASPEGLEGKRVAIADGTTHAAFVKQFFRGSRILVYDDIDKAREALKAGEVDVVFDDAISLSFWLNGTSSEQCCEFKGGAFHEPRFFGDGLAISVPKGDGTLAADVNGALRQVRASGRFLELVTRYFPYRVY